jgi:hypothetical protein
MYTTMIDLLKINKLTCFIDQTVLDFAAIHTSAFDSGELGRSIIELRDKLAHEKLTLNHECAPCPVCISR